MSYTRAILVKYAISEPEDIDQEQDAEAQTEKIQYEIVL